MGLSLVSRSALKARALALFVWMGFGIAHSIVTAEFLNARIPFLRYLGVVFPAEHRQSLWSPDWSRYVLAAVALLVISLAGFLAGYSVFRRRDA